MDKLFYYNDLFDIYEELLTDKQKDYFRDYYFDNLSYGEIGDKYSVSRNAVFKQLKMATDKLEELKEKLHVYKIFNQIKDKVNEISDENIKNDIMNILDNGFKS